MDFLNHLKDSEVQEVLREGTDLRKYSCQIEKELKEVESQSIQKYVKESINIVNLHRQIEACDDILERMEKMLIGFQSDLGSISSEIVNLQKRSVAMSQQLHNRQAVKGLLSQFIEDMAISESVVRIILGSPVTDKEFSEQLSILNHKINFVAEQKADGVKCCEDVMEILENLKFKAVAKIRSYLLEQVSKFKRPMSNYQIPQNTMLKNKELFEFMARHEWAAGQEVCHEYVSAMSKIYFSYFKSYLSYLSKLMFEEEAGREDLLGSCATETTGRGLFHKPASRYKNTVFTLGNRGSVLTSNLESPIIIPHSTPESSRFGYEALFRSQQYALVDNACREYLFILEFFLVTGSTALELFSKIMGKTLNLLMKNLDSYVLHSFDCVCLLLCSELIERYRNMCHQRAVPALDSYWDALQNIVWPRFEAVFVMNIASIKTCDPSTFDKKPKPHYVTRRVAEFCLAMVWCSSEKREKPVGDMVLELTEELDLLLLRFASFFPQIQDQLVFLICNYDLALTILSERVNASFKPWQILANRLNATNTQYVNEILIRYLPSVIEFVKKNESKPDVANGGKEVVEWVNSHWKNSLDSLDNEIMNSFPMFVLGSSLKQLVFASFLQYYDRLHKLLSPQLRAQLVNIHHIKQHLKKYRTSFS